MVLYSVLLGVTVQEIMKTLLNKEVKRPVLQRLVVFMSWMSIPQVQAMPQE